MRDLIIRQAIQSDIPTLKKLWQVCFDDDLTYIDTFFDEMFIADNTVVAQIFDDVVGVIHLLKRKLNDKTFLYGYAIGVFPEYRGKNICKSMLDKIKEYTKKNDILFGLHPANEKLAEFYQKIGLNEMYSLKEVDATSFSYDEKYVLDDITIDEFFNLRKEAFKNCVEWDKNALNYMLKNCETVKKINIDDNERYFVISKHNDLVTVKETTAKDDEIIKISNSIKEYYNVKKIRYFMLSDGALQGVIKPMIYGFLPKDDNVYMNLFLDWGDIWKKKEFLILMQNKYRY